MHKQAPETAAKNFVSVSLLPYNTNPVIFITLAQDSKGNEDYLTVQWTTDPLEIPNNYLLPSSN